MYIKNPNISSDEDDSAAAMHFDDSEGDVVVIGYKPSLKEGEELGNSWEFYFRHSGSLDEVINIKFLEKGCFLFHLFSFKK